MPEILTVCGILVCALVLILAVRTVRPEFAYLIALAAGLFCILYALKRMEGALLFVRSLMEESAYGSSFSILFKALGVALLTSAISEFCRDLGQGALSRGAELVGKGVVIALSFPILQQFLELLKEALGAGV